MVAYKLFLKEGARVTGNTSPYDNFMYTISHVHIFNLHILWALKLQHMQISNWQILTMALSKGCHDRWVLTGFGENKLIWFTKPNLKRQERSEHLEANKSVPSVSASASASGSQTESGWNKFLSRFNTQRVKYYFLHRRPDARASSRMD